MQASHSHFFLVQCESDTADAALDSTRDAFEDAFKEANAFQKLIQLQNERKKAYKVFAEHDEHDDEDVRVFVSLHGRRRGGWRVVGLLAARVACH